MSDRSADYNTRLTKISGRSVMSIEKIDGLVTCPRCGSNVCYAQRVGDDETWLCMTCGFTSTTLMYGGSETEQQVSERQPQLYKDLKFVDQAGYVWYPTVISQPETGMVYLDGTSKDDCRWVAVPLVLIPRPKRRSLVRKGLLGKDQKYLADHKNSRAFDFEQGFIEALSYLNMV